MPKKPDATAPASAAVVLSFAVAANGSSSPAATPSIDARALPGAGVVVSGSARRGARSLPTEHVASRGVTAAARMSRVA